jgi:hypothetical protein
MKVILGDGFKKEFNKLKKKYRSLEQDFESFLVVLKTCPEGNKSKHWNCLKRDEKKAIFKTRLMCRALNAASLRLIYFYDGQDIEIEFIEIYFKGNKTNHDQQRINTLWKQKNMS